MFCPRCDQDKAIKFYEAPKDGSWELYRCQRCDFVWRSTEKEEIRNRQLYPAEFKLNEDQMAKMTEKPTIPPLRKPGKP
ncbi:MAG TPA: non-oxidative hydroxyarylic acid decarboxylases subunit D [Thermodesulfobacteriota bacterium]|nr:non-oxidative hydroxyarylic acid decarboxylases subunit D [Thermodesulfobacteriota bacterium]